MSDEKQEKFTKQISSSLEEIPDSIESYIIKAESYLINGMFAEAEPHLTKALAIDEENAEIHNHLGVVYFYQDNYDKAEHHFKRALQIDPDMVESYFNLGMLYQKQGKFKDALPFYKVVVNSEPDNAEAYYFMGQCYLSLEMIQETKIFFVESFKLFPTPRTALDLSILYISQEEYPEAEQMLNFLINMADESKSKRESMSDNSFFDDEIESLHFTMGLVLKKQEKYTEALQHFHDIVAMNDQNEQAFNYLGECCVAVGLDNEAESFFTQANKLEPDYIQPIINIGNLYYKQENFYKTILAIERFLEVKIRLTTTNDEDLEKSKDPEIEFAYEILGKAYIQMGEKEKAIKAWEDSLEINPDQPDIISLINSSPSPS